MLKVIPLIVYEDIQYYDKALAIDPNVNLWGNKGRSLNSLGKHKEAIECFDKALKLNPNGVTDW